MKKNKKQDSSQPGKQGMFYAQKLCPVCENLIWGSSPKSHRAANSDLGQRLKRHKQECQKQGKQLKLSIPGREEKQTESIKRVTLRGEEKSV